jgi:enoyl-CoA hydratase/carnithine racemase
MFETLLLEARDGVYTLTLNQPQNRNAMSHRMAGEFEEAIARVREDLDARFLILTGAGESFCSGGDFDSIIRDFAMPAVDFQPHILAFYRKFLRLRDLPIPTMAAVNGHAAGGGFSLALACDMRMASSQAQFIMTFVHLGIHPGMGATHALPRLVGTARAFEIFLTGEPVSAQEAFAMGLVNRVVAPEALMAEAVELARKIAASPRLPVRYLKRSIYMGAQSGLDEILDFESFAQALCSETEDLKRGIAAFEKRRRGPARG